MAVEDALAGRLVNEARLSYAGILFINWIKLGELPCSIYQLPVTTAKTLFALRNSFGVREADKKEKGLRAPMSKGPQPIGTPKATSKKAKM